MEPIVDVPAPDGSSVPLTRNPIRLSRTPPTYRSAPPDLPAYRLRTLRRRSAASMAETICGSSGVTFVAQRAISRPSAPDQVLGEVPHRRPGVGLAREV